jgi:N-acetylneuraminic acid mutarotase
MRSASIEERVRDYIEGERAQIPVPGMLAPRILHALDATRPAPRHSRVAFVPVAAAIVALLFLAIGVAWMRAATMPAGIELGTWSSASSMSVPRAYQTATLLPSGKVLVVGGRGLNSLSAPWQPAGKAIASAELYDPKTGRWSSAGVLSAPRFAHTATLLPDGKVLVVGGNQTMPNADFPAGLDTLSSAELYDPKTNTWSLAGGMRTARASHTATLLADGRVLVAGGISPSMADPWVVLASAELYDPAANSWRLVAPMPSPRQNQSATLLSDGRVLMVGGLDRIGDSPLGSAPPSGLSSVDIFDPTTDSWSAAPTMRYPRISPTVTLLPNGHVLVVGDSGLNEQSAEIFDPATYSWSPGPKPAAGRAGHVGVRLHSGVVLIAGGLVTSTAEVFDWRRNAWVSAGSLAVLRSGATATVLGNGQVLVVGGFSSKSTAWSTAELYDPRGTAAVGVVRKSTPVSALGTALLLGSLAVLLGFGMWLRRRSLARQWQAGEIWVD